MLGVGPYITSSIIFQLLTMVIPSLEEMSKESEAGQKKIKQWTRIAVEQPHPRSVLGTAKQQKRLQEIA